MTVTLAKQIELTTEVQTDGWWEDVNLPMLETVRNRLRGLVQSIEKRKRKVLYTDVADELGEQVEIEIEIEGIVRATDIDRFRQKARHYLQEHRDTLAIEKLYRNRPSRTATSPRTAS